MQQQPLFLKINNDRVIGLFGNITELHHMTDHGDDGTDSYWLTCAGEPYQVESHEFQILMAWASHPDRCIFVRPDEQVSDYQDYKARGGFMTFDDWKEKYRRHQRLVKELGAIDNPSQTLVNKVGELKGALLL